MYTFRRLVFDQFLLRFILVFSYVENLLICFCGCQICKGEILRNTELLSLFSMQIRKQSYFTLSSKKTVRNDHALMMVFYSLGFESNMTNKLFWKKRIPLRYIFIICIICISLFISIIYGIYIYYVWEAV